MTDPSKTKSDLKAILDIANNSGRFSTGAAVMFTAVEIYLVSALGSVYLAEGEEACRKKCEVVSDDLTKTFDLLLNSCLFDSIEDLVHCMEGEE